MFARNGPIPIYDILESLDNCLYSKNTIWAGELEAGNTFIYDSAKQAGTQFICDSTALQSFQDSQYDCLLACHCLEHIANPLRALREWKRVLREEGLLLLILPHKDGTFDWRRPITPLVHMIEDYKNGVGEDDLTHLAEILELHDLSRDLEAGTKEQFEQRCLANYTNRAMHHHVFDTRAALELLNYTGFNIIRVDYIQPLHILILASGAKESIKNNRFLNLVDKRLSSSPFPSDHQQNRV